MRPARLALVPILEASGFMVLGQSCRPIYYIPRSFFCGLGSMSFFDQITRQWSLF